MTQVMKSSDVRQQWGQLINKVFRDHTRVVVEKSGIPVAAVISAEELERLTRLDEQRKESFKALDKIREVFKSVPSDDLEIEVSKALSEVRVERRTNK